MDRIALPTPEQQAWQDLEVGMFFHFDIPVFTDLAERDWPKSGRLDPAIFDPRKLDTDQWMEAAKAIGARYTVFVAKHCSGFLTWQSDLYPYGVKQSPWRGGKGDIVRDYVASSRRAGIQPGLYANVTASAYWEVSNPGLVGWGKGGDPARQAAYARVCEGMLRELWGNYGPLTEVWFDGGALPPERGGPDMLPLLRTLQPKAAVFQGPAATIRWIGNEGGHAGYPCWATIDTARIEEMGKAGWGPELQAALEHGQPDAPDWLPGECDVPVRNHDWFWHPGREGALYSVEDLLGMYERSVGRNCNLLLNANINRDGLVPEPDMQRYRELGREIRRRFGSSVAETSGRGDLLELALPRPTVVEHVVVMEDIALGERIREYAIEGRSGAGWATLCRGSSVGHKRIERIEPTELSALRLTVTKHEGEPSIRRLAAYVKPE